MAKYIKKTNRITKPTKYTEEWVLNEVTELLKILMSPEGKKKYLTLQDLIENRGYPRQVISVWRNDFAKNKAISDTIKSISNELENKLYKLALTGKVNGTVGIFGLKCNYKWNDNPESEREASDNTVIIE